MSISNQLSLIVPSKFFIIIKSSHTKITLVFALLCVTTGFLNAQVCNCTHVITPEQYNIDGNNMNVKPGDTVCIQASEKKLLRIINFHGTAEQYIVFKNCGGEVVIQNDDELYGVSISNSSYFRFTGSGSKDITYGIKILKTKVGGTMGIGIGNKSTNYEIDHIEIANTGFAGIMAKTDPKCDLSTNRGNFTQYQSVFHDNYIHNTGGEGMYIGHSFYSGWTTTCDGQKVVLLPNELKGVRIYNNILDSIGWDGIQVGSATEDCEIYGNKITNYGIKAISSQNSGIQIGGGTTGKCYNNYIANGSGNGMAVFGLGNNDIYNNVIVNAGRNNFPNDATIRAYGIFVDDRATIPGTSFNFYNNTIISPKTDGIRFYSVISKNNKFYNNIIINPGSLLHYSKYSKETPYINIGGKDGVDAIISNNFFDKNFNAIHFEDPENNNYKLQSTSPAINTGLNLAGLGIKYDFDNNVRRLGNSSDKGAYEYQGVIEPKRIEKPAIDYKAFPNPCYDKLNISINETSKVNISIYNSMGNIILKRNNVTDSEIELYISDLAFKGKCFININNGKISTTKTMIIQ